ncbi:LysM peptidoglycan-binding domain-containing protein [Paenibacillus sp. CAU 1782]
MSSGSDGLRFDVYERVHLPDDVAAIDELEEIELVPRIQVIDQGDQAILKGQLLLSGVYRSAGGAAGPLTLEHWIPVEISLPMNRVSRLDDISIEIDNFDVDLISARTLNITGVLSLRGISVEPLEEQQWEDEPITAVHQREFADGDQAAVIGAQPEEQSYITENSDEEAARFNYSENGQEQYGAEIVIEPGNREEGGWLQWNAIAEQEAQQNTVNPAAWGGNSGEGSPYGWQGYDYRQTHQTEAVEEVDQSTSGWEQTDDGGGETVRPPEETPAYAEEQHLHAEQWTQAEQWAHETSETIREPDPYQPGAGTDEPQGDILQAASEFQDAEARESQETEAVGRRQEVQIAFASKPAPGTEREQQEGLGFRTLLQSSKREQAAREAAQQQSSEQEAEENARKTAPEDEIQWKQLFLAKPSEGNEFRKIRLCIVQREETLEQIATRYSLNPREILIHNRLHESAVEEGQLLYIP